MGQYLPLQDPQGAGQQCGWAGQGVPAEREVRRVPWQPAGGEVQVGGGPPGAGGDGRDPLAGVDGLPHRDLRRDVAEDGVQRAAVLGYVGMADCHLVGWGMGW